MKFALILSLLVSLLILPNANASDWRPLGFESLSEPEKDMIKIMTPINHQNKTAVQLLFDVGSFQNCAMGTAITNDKIFLTINEKGSSTRHRFVLSLNKALTSEDRFSRAEMPIYVLVFDQKATNETIFMYFLLTKQGRVDAMRLIAKKNHMQGIPIISKYVGKTEPSYELICVGNNQ